MYQQLIEFLESRRLLSGSTVYSESGIMHFPGDVQGFVINDGELHVVGTGGRDKIEIHEFTRNGGVAFDVTVRNVTARFKGITMAYINSLGGGDKIILSSQGTSRVPNATLIDLGDGDDKAIIHDFDGLVTVQGGAGDDVLNARNAVCDEDRIGIFSGRTIDGGVDNDTLIGSNIGDGMFGGDGNDLVRGRGGDDYISGGRGENGLRGGIGDDSFIVDPLAGLDGTGADYANMGGDNQINGGRGFDTIEYFSNSNFQPYPEYGTTTFVHIEAAAGIDIAGALG